MVKIQVDFNDEENSTIGVCMYEKKLKDKREAVRWIVQAYANQREGK